MLDVLPLAECDDLELWIDEFERQLPARTVGKARDLIRRDRIALVESSGLTARGTARGTSEYHLDLSYEGDSFGAHCSCPAARRYALCKHLFAFFLYVGDRHADAKGRPRPSGVAAGQVQRQHWSGALTRVQSKVRQSMFAFGARASDSGGGDATPIRFLVEVRRGWYREVARVACHEPGRRGGLPLGRELSLAVALRRCADHPTLRKLVSRLLEVAIRDQPQRAYGRSFVPEVAGLPAESADELLCDVVRSGHAFRLGGRDGARPLTWDESGPWTPKFHEFEEDEARCIGVRLSRGERTLDLDALVPVSGTSLVLAGDHLARIAFADTTDRVWFEEVCERGPVRVWKPHLEEFVTNALQGAGLPRGVFPELDVVRDVMPRPVLSLERPTPRSHPRGVLTWEYGELSTRGSQGAALNVPDARRWILRDIGAERADRERLLATPGVVAMPHEPDADVRVPPGDVPEAAEHLLAQGFVVELDGRLLRRGSAVGTHVSSGTDWFELESSMKFEGQVVPLPDVLAALKNKQRTIRLADGTDGLLPADVEDHWGVLRHLGRKRGDKLRFSRAQATLLDALLDTLDDVDWDAEFERIREAARSFRRVEPLHEPPEFVGELRPYQRAGLGWLATLRSLGLSGCLADDMGLGKTVQVLAMLAARRREREGEPRLPHAPTLVVAPRSVVFNWKAEAERFAPELRVVAHSGPERFRKPSQFEDVDLVITTYGLLRNDVELLASVRFDYAILDEAQGIKNPSSQTALAARTLQADHRLALTGTPVENRLSDLWSIMEFLNPGLLGTKAGVKRLARAAATDPEARKQLAKGLRPVLLRRTKEQVAPELPPCTEQEIRVELSPAQRKLYDELKEHYRTTLLAQRSGGPDDEAPAEEEPERFAILEALLRLRQAACHTALVGAKGRRARSAKLDALLPLLEEATGEGHKVLVYSQFTSFLGHLRSALDEAGIDHLYLDGTTRDRESLVRRFQEEADPQVFVISLKAGGVGLNLTAADYVFVLDPWWNPAAEAQAIDRTHRIGQTRAVMAYRLIAADTVEERVLDLQATKRALADDLLGPSTSLSADLTREDLALLLS